MNSDMPHEHHQAIIDYAEMQKALRIAADAIEKAMDIDPSIPVNWLEIDTPKEWEFRDAEKGWCSVDELTAKLRELAGGENG